MISEIGLPQPGGALPGNPTPTGPSRPPAPQADRLDLQWGKLSPELQQALHAALQASPDGATLSKAHGSTSIPEALDRVLNLGGGGSLSQALSGLSSQDRADTLKALADLLRHGVVGYEYRKINGEPQKVFIDVAIGSDMSRAPLVRKPRFEGLF